MRHKRSGKPTRKCETLKSVILIRSLLKLLYVTVYENNIQNKLCSYQTSKQKINYFLGKIQAYENAHRLATLGEERLST